MNCNEQIDCQYPRKDTRVQSSKRNMYVLHVCVCVPWPRWWYLSNPNRFEYDKRQLNNLNHQVYSPRFAESTICWCGIGGSRKLGFQASLGWSPFFAWKLPWLRVKQVNKFQGSKSDDYSFCHNHGTRKWVYLQDEFPFNWGNLTHWTMIMGGYHPGWHNLVAFFGWTKIWEVVDAQDFKFFLGREILDANASRSMGMCGIHEQTLV